MSCQCSGTNHDKVPPRAVAQELKFDHTICDDKNENGDAQERLQKFCLFRLSVIFLVYQDQEENNLGGLGVL